MLYDYYLTREEEEENDMQHYQNIIVNRFNGDIRVSELTPIDGHKSFGHRAKVLEDNKSYYLLSYSTIVCEYRKADNIFIRYWDDYSATTMRHINSFLRYVGFYTGAVGGKKWWNALTPNKEYTVSEMLNI